ncbi:MAG: AI-2E family transporter [Candidatus Syntrophoarchaeum sp. WYZ-LMO15]|nr:MAG: AI-2E family transporter [Candidatus Syntrophoarchaeum sp. WYZ-LMO15]
MEKCSDQDRIFYIILGVIIIAAFLILLKVISPIVDGIILGIVSAYVSRPIKARFAFLGKAISSGIATLCVIVPILIIVIMGLIEAVKQLIWVISHQAEILGGISAFIGADLPFNLTDVVYRWLPDLIGYITPLLHSIISLETTMNLGILLLNIFVLIVVSYYLLADGERIIDAILKVTPPGNEGLMRRYIEEVDRTISGIYIGNFTVALLIGILTVPFLYAFRVPMIALIAALIFLAALIPLFAKWMVWLPISVYLFYRDGIYPAVAFFALVLIFIDVMPEFFLRPRLIGITSRIHPLPLVLAFIGGGITGGVAGFFGAPLLLGALVAAYNVYTLGRGEGSNGQELDSEPRRSREEII